MDIPGSSNEAPSQPRAVTNTTHSETPQLLSPPDTKTPPTEAHKRHHDAVARDRGSEPVDPSALSRALTKFERQHDRTPGLSPSRKRQRVMGDR
jgi:cell division cycle 20-like protein 1 (cofactor of APC complex)